MILTQDTIEDWKTEFNNIMHEDFNYPNRYYSRDRLDDIELLEAYEGFTPEDAAIVEDSKHTR